MDGCTPLNECQTEAYGEDNDKGQNESKDEGKDEEDEDKDKGKDGGIERDTYVILMPP